MIRMSRKNYSRSSVVRLSTCTSPRRGPRSAASPPIWASCGARRQWLDAYGTGKKTAVDRTLTSSPLRSNSPSAPEVEHGQKIARLEFRVNELEVETTKLTTEREILQRAAKYFAGRRW